MRFTRKLLAVLIVLSMVLALAPKSASAAGPAWPTVADARKAQADYLKSLDGTSGTTENVHVKGLVVDGFQIPADVAATKAFKDGYVRDRYCSWRYACHLCQGPVFIAHQNDPVPGGARRRQDQG